MSEKGVYSVSANQKLSELVLINPDVLLMIEHFGIEMPFTDKDIAVICEEHKINVGLFTLVSGFYIRKNIVNEYLPVFDDIDTIIKYLENSHEYYLNEKYPEIVETIKSMSEVNSHKEMALVRKFFDDYFNEVKEHLDYEDKIVFPYVTSLYNALQGVEKTVSNTSYSVSEYKTHHNDIEEKLDDLKKLLLKYLPKNNDSKIRRKLLIQITEVEFDLSIHSHIEDKILIPLVSKLETQIKK
jgi:regulator of cell morphogenesis and NO signaling